MPETINASSTADGPTSGTILMPASCAAATSSAPGSATPGQPASLSIPISRPARAGDKSACIRCGGIVARDTCEQGDAQSFCLDRTCAIVRAFAVEVSPKRGVFDIAKSRYDVDQCSAT